MDDHADIPPEDPTAELEFVNRPLPRKVVSALSLRLAGATLADICEVVGFASTKEAANAIDRALRDELKSDPANRDKMRNIANQRLNRLLRSVWGKATDPEHTEHLQALGRAREILSDYVRWNGLAAPSQMVLHTPENSEIHQWVSAILAERDDIPADEDVLDGEVISDQPE